MTLEELTRQLRQLEAGWNGLDQAPAMEIMRLERRRREMLRDMIGCCGEPQVIDVECVYEDVVFHRYTVRKCPIDGRSCRHAEAGFGVVDLNSLNDVLGELANESTS